MSRAQSVDECDQKSVISQEEQTPSEQDDLESDDDDMVEYEPGISFSPVASSPEPFDSFDILVRDFDDFLYWRIDQGGSARHTTRNIERFEEYRASDMYKRGQKNREKIMKCGDDSKILYMDLEDYHAYLIDNFQYDNIDYDLPKHVTKFRKFMDWMFPDYFEQYQKKGCFGRIISSITESVIRRFRRPTPSASDTDQEAVKKPKSPVLNAIQKRCRSFLGRRSNSVSPVQLEEEQ